ncbi:MULTISPECIES: hypothetical protein [Pseudomonas]|uniref:Uncharacterized protein n=2 Tax=Pseudomonas chlororaphis TaxID=587753 RepID=A0AAQ1J8P9_9PSED|nr:MULTISPECIES: hypothetical protein [Pseudomonas]AVO62363.1 hypothetical protein C6Q18_24855 [Pseudomonas chlororaphis subsp. piscium]AZC33217.1 hypothetical protein C4K38_5281 [Pseudomonas chlororaphis subsp. piscium]AZC39744.1 hypothetical protein C4K37_5381 [Pseudomonas chlororaphis subsp. piscium]AZC46296.1 hypothetical protein C4K36_5395 [Pseudomonas chlororaphis subsp. piscium]AZC53027.1 hypothetical protein C4K35_5468 [Pseudomonas chlororaphis subsp. piscium]
MKQYIPFLLLYLLLMPLYYWMKPYPLRKWTGLAMGLAGLLWILFLPPMLGDIDTGLAAVALVTMGSSLFFSRRRYQDHA